MIGRTYLEHGKPVVALARWEITRPGPVLGWLEWLTPPKGAPRNVLIRREDGTEVVRPFRGLRKPG